MLPMSIDSCYGNGRYSTFSTMLTTLFSPVKRGYLLGFFSCVLLLLGLLGGQTLFAQGDPHPDWELPGAHIYSTFPYYASIAGVTVIQYGAQYLPLDVNGDGLLDWVYKDPTTEYVHLNNGAGWELAYSCRFRNNTWIDDCEYRNTPAAVAALSVAEPCTYVAEEGYWEGDCSFIPR